MATRVSSPRLIGRQSELDVLVAAFKAAASEERASTYLIGGEAGVGKTRLVAELAARVEEAGGLVASGSCIEFVHRALPFGPIVQALRDAHRHLDPALQAAVVGDAEPALARLLPELDHHGDDAGDGGAALFEHLLGTIIRLGDRIPTLLLLEDLHWADHSTRDFLVFLARNLRDARVLVVGTFRTDDLHRRHPLRPVLAELERSGAVTRVDLPRFDRDEIAELIAAIRGDVPDPDLVARTFERSDGNAFFAEELLAAEELWSDTLPESLRDIVLARVDALSESAQRALRVLSVIGRSADYRLVTAVADIPEAELNDGLRDAVAHQVLVAEPDGLAYRFRHALVYEAIYEDLLPSERVRLHVAIADQLEREPDWYDGDATELASELVCHWTSAHDQRRALPATLEAARSAEQMYAYPEALQHTEAALALWGQVADAPALTGMSHVRLLRHAGDIAQMSGRFDRAVAYIREAVDEVDPEADPVEAGLVHERLGRFLWQVNRPAEEYLVENFTAVELIPPEPPTVERARVLATLGQQLMLAGRNTESIDICWQAIDVAQRSGARIEEGHARNTLGTSLSGIGRFDDGRVELERARDIALETGSWDDVARAAVNLGSNLQSSGQWEAALQLSLEGAEIARRHGLDRACGGFLRFNAAECLYELGRWDEMEEQIREADAIDIEGLDRMKSRMAYATLYAGLGRYDDAREHLALARALRAPNDDTSWLLEYALIDARIHAWSGDADRALEIARQAMEPAFVFSACSDSGPMLMLLGASLAPDAATAAAFADALDRWIAEKRWSGGLPSDVRMIQAQLEAEQHREDPARWQAVADAWDRASRIPHAAYARLRQAEAHRAMGDRAAAEAALQDADAMATRMGFAWLSARTAALARAHNLDLGVALVPATPAEQAGLTAREREVLELLSEGRTNRQIGEVLFISTKTASVHVSNILAKLQVANRGEAAATARRLGLVA